MATKSRLIFLLRYLYENTDDDHAISTNDLIAVLANNGFSANRKTIRDDVDMLCDAGYEIFVDKDGKSNSYHYGSRTFELPELKMLVDAVSSSRFISAEKSDVLIQKLTSLASKHHFRRRTRKAFNRIQERNSTAVLFSSSI